MIALLRECGALARVMPEVDRALADGGSIERLAARVDTAADRGHSLPVRFALLVIDLGAGEIASLVQRINAPTDCRDLARIASAERNELRGQELDAQALLSILERIDAFRRPERLERLIEMAECDAASEKPMPAVPRQLLVAALEAARNVDAGAAARENPDDIPGAVRRARLVAIASLQPPTGN